MRARALVLLATVTGCRPSAPAPLPGDAGATSTSTSARAAAADPLIAQLETELAAEAMRAPLPSLPVGTKLGVRLCLVTGRAGAPVQYCVSLILPPPEDAPASPAPTTPTGQGWSVDPKTKPGAILSRPDFAALRRDVALHAQDANGALAIARAKLVALPRYAGWRREGLTYTTTLQQGSTPPTRWSVYFRRSEPEIDTIAIEVDLAARTATE